MSEKGFREEAKRVIGDVAAAITVALVIIDLALAVAVVVQALAS